MVSTCFKNLLWIWVNNVTHIRCLGNSRFLPSGFNVTSACVLDSAVLTTWKTAHDVMCRRGTREKHRNKKNKSKSKKTLNKEKKYKQFIKGIVAAPCVEQPRFRSIQQMIGLCLLLGLHRTHRHWFHLGFLPFASNLLEDF